DMALYARSLERNWGALPEGVEDGQRDLPPSSESLGVEKIQGHGRSERREPEAGEPVEAGPGAAEAGAGASAELAGGDGPAAELNERLLRAINSLDPKDDTHWVGGGKPAMAAVERLYG